MYQIAFRILEIEPFCAGAGTVQIPGMVWNLNVSQATFLYLQSQQLVQQREFNTAAIRNDMLLQVAVAYLDLLRAEELRAVTVVIRDDAKEVAPSSQPKSAAG